MNKRYSDIEILEAFRAGGRPRERAWEYIYHAWRSLIIGPIAARGGSPEEALDALQEVAIRFEHRVRRADFELRHKLSTYLVKCVYNEWLKGKMQAKNVEMENIDDVHLTEFIASVEDDVVKGEVGKALGKSLEIVGERCKTILLLFLNGFSMQEIAEQMGFKGEQVAKNEKRKCMSAFIAYVKEDPVLMKHIKSLIHG